jgi:hypothetical protein
LLRIHPVVSKQCRLSLNLALLIVKSVDGIICSSTEEEKKWPMTPLLQGFDFSPEGEPETTTAKTMKIYQAFSAHLSLSSHRAFTWFTTS